MKRIGGIDVFAPDAIQLAARKVGQSYCVPCENYVVEANVPTIILFCVICKDIENLYKWQTFRPKGFYQSQIRMQNLAPMKAFEPKRLPFI